MTLPVAHASDARWAHARPQLRLTLTRAADKLVRAGEVALRDGTGLADVTRPSAAHARGRHYLAARARLRDAVCHCAVSLRSAGAPPEQVVAFVRATVEPLLDGPADTRRETLDDVMRSCVGAYYPG